MGTPLELIRYNVRTSKFEIGTAALETLRKVNGPVAVVAVCGRARQGKSFILNQLLLQSSGGGFQVGATVRPCTKGLWMWSSPQRMTLPDGSVQNLVLLDTEGVDAYDQTAQYSTQIFSLAVLLSSLFVYNQMGGIDESALDKLSLVTEMAKHVRVRASAANNGEESLGEHSPNFLWLLRDFYLQLEEEGGRKITAKEYLETALCPVPGTGQGIAAKNAIRQSIVQLFPSRDCFTLVRPMNDETQLTQMDQLPREKLRPEFRQGVEELTDIIFRRATPKRFGSQLMTGPVLAGLVNAYVTAINEGAVPTIATAWQGVAESECRRGCDAAEATYSAAWAAGGQVPAEEVELEARHQKCMAAARAAYEEVAVGDEAIRKAHEARWTAAVLARYKELRGRRLAEAAAAVTELLYKGASEIAQAARSGEDIGVLQQRITAFVALYEKSAAGPTKWHKLAAFLQETWPAIANQVLERHANAAKAALEALQREFAEVRSRLAAETKRAEQAERLHNDATSTIKSLQQQLAGLQQETIRMGTVLEQKSSTATSLQQQLGEARQEATRLQSALEQKSNSANLLLKQLSETQQQVASLRATLEQKSTLAESSQKQLLASQEEVTRLRGAVQEKSAMATSLEQQLGDLRQEGVRLRAALDQRTAKVSALEAQMSEVLLVSERKQASASDLAEARIRAVQEAQQAKVAEMTAALTAERARVESLSADLEGLQARCSSAEARIAAQEADASEWRAKYMREATVRVELQGQRDQTRDSLALLTVERDSIARERDAARAELEQLRADLQAEAGANRALQARLDEAEAEAQAARTQPFAAGPSDQGAAAAVDGTANTSSHDHDMDNDENERPDGPLPGTSAGEAAGGDNRVLVDASNSANMTIADIKSALTDAGYFNEVWALTYRKPPPKKADWVNLLKSHAN